ncbi:outer membrane beta-barrel protein [Portibacter lacus]|uniref:Outer membrane protein beta-barrel domain-containing protein n=1 Tax=Portibacter lacus TaxID=1099794 RepID=A0AA37SS66_9BACT|nr:hypothetical protein [Portibacter lacus]GLR19277.1 hypothetical protein GCM10007940_38930 [Portibacter lacus]
MKDNNNIEDFFKHSLEGFNDVPSDQVWKNIDGELGNSSNIWKRNLLGFLSVSLGIALLCLACYSYNLKQELNTKIDQLNSSQHTINTYHSENLSLNKEVKLLNQEINEIKVSDENANIKKIVPASTEQYTSSQNTRSHNKTIYDINQSRNFNENINLHAINDSVDSNFTDASILTDEANSRQNYAESLDRENSKLAISELRKTRTQITIPEKSASQLTKDKKLKFLNPNLTFNGIESANYSTGNIKYGLTGSILGTGTEVTSGLNPGFSAGLEMEMKLYKQLWFTTDLRFNRNNYVMEFMGVNPQQESDFPTPRTLSATFNNVDVQNSYFDFPVGLSYNIALGKNNVFFVNPGFSWQFYLPQKFIYNTVENDRVLYSEERYFVYFGSAFLNIGVERKISKNNIFQLGLWAEKGLEDYGIENRNIMNYGLKVSLLFTN